MNNLVSDSIDQGWLRVRVPSHGVFYDGKLPDGWCHVRKLKVHEEAILQTNGMSVSDRIDTIVQNCVKLPDGFRYTLPGTSKEVVGIAGLLMTDRMALLLLQRHFTFGSQYTFPWNCPACSASNKADILLVRDLDPTTPDNVEAAMRDRGISGGFTAEPFPVTLPDAQTVAHCRFLRAGDEQHILRRSKRQVAATGNSAADPQYVMTLAAHIVSVDSKPDWASLDDVVRENWVRQLSGADSAAIRGEIERRETGIDMSVMLRCHNCSAESEVGMRLSADFFCPTGR